jgi:hypothetical protein
MAYIGVVKPDDAAAKKQEEDARKALEERRKAEERGEAAKLEGLVAQPKAIRTPSDVVGVVVTSVVVLLFLRQVLATMALEGLAHMVDSLIAFLPHVFVACAVVGAGLWAGRWAKQRIDELTRSSEDRVARALGAVARIGIIAFASMMALQQLGVGQQLITLAFALILGAACLAAALAFGLGGRDVAGKIVTREYDRRADREGKAVEKPGAAE